MPIVNHEQYPHIHFFNECDFLEIGTTSSGRKIIQIGEECGEPIVTVGSLDSIRSQDLKFAPLYSLLKMSYDHYVIYDQPKKLIQNVKTIHKYTTPAKGKFNLNLPIDAEVLTVKLLNNKPCLWVLIDTEKPNCQRNFCWIRTGEPIEDNGLIYIETLQFNNENKVSHLFELVVS